MVYYNSEGGQKCSSAPTCLYRCVVATNGGQQARVPNLCTVYLITACSLLVTAAKPQSFTNTFYRVYESDIHEQILSLLIPAEMHLTSNHWHQVHAQATQASPQEDLVLHPHISTAIFPPGPGFHSAAAETNATMTAVDGTLDSGLLPRRHGTLMQHVGQVASG